MGWAGPRAQTARVADTGADEVARLDARIVALQQESVRAAQALATVQAALHAALLERGTLVAPLAASPSPLSALSALLVPAELPHDVEPLAPGQLAAPETSTRTVQNLLFVLGGLLLATAAIVFTAVAWATFGLIGRATILSVVTLIALAAPALALARRLRATAETFVAIGLLLVVLDGYAAWYVDLAGVQAMDGRRYAGVVAAVTTVIALAYGRLARLTAPGFVAVFVGQPVVALLVAPANPGATASALLACGVAAVDALVAGAALRTPRQSNAQPVLGAFAWVAFLGWVLTAVVTSQWTLLTAAPDVPAAARAAATTVVVSLVIFLGAWVTGERRTRNVGAGVVAATVLYAGTVASVVAWPRHTVLAAALVALVVCLAARLVAAVLPAGLRSGPRHGAGVVAALWLLLAAEYPVRGTVLVVTRSYPFWSAPLSGTPTRPESFVWEIPVAVLALAVAIALVGPQWTRWSVPVTGATAAVLMLPAFVALPWWSPPAVDLAGAALLAATFLRWQQRTTVIAAAVLVADALVVGNARPGQTALTLTGVLALGLGLAILARPGAVRDVALAVGLSAVPPAIGSALVAYDVEPWWAARATLAATVLLLAVVALTRRSGAGVAAVLAAVSWPMALAHIGGESLGVYSGLSLLLLAGTVALLPPTDTWRAIVGLATVVPGAAYLVAVLPAALAVSAYPYGWLGSVWTGAPTGLGLAPAGLHPASVRATDAVALALLALACGLVGYAVRRRVWAFLAGLGVGGPTAGLTAVAAAGVPWPVLPGVTLLLGLLLGFVVALGRGGPWRSTILSAQSIVYLGAGVAGALGAEWSTLVALGTVVVAGAVIGGIGRRTGWRVAGCVVAVCAAVGEASAAGLAADLRLREVGFWVLVPGIVAIFGGALLGRSPHRRTRRWRPRWRATRRHSSP
jgi:hypothetical protein